ncbi:MAG: hypothetical protein RIC56_03825 [Pseudomonadales bacterium]
MTSFEQALAEQVLHVCWAYRLHGGDETRMVCPNGATRDEVIDILALKFPGRPLSYLKPVIGGCDGR